jgi:hypothetical protein
MAKVRKGQAGEVNKSAAIRELLKQNPHVTASEVVSTLAARGIKVNPSLFYFTKGKLKGRKGRRRKIQRQVANVMGSNGVATPTNTGDVLATIKKVKGLAAEVGGLKKLTALVEALSQ